MKKSYLITLAAVAAFLLLSCEKKAVETEQTVHYLTFTGTLDAGDSKVSVAADGKTSWVAGDEILFHGRNAGGKYSSTVTLAAGDISADGRSFTVTIPEYTSNADEAKWNSYGASSDVYAAYPASAVAVDNGATNWYNSNKFNTSNTLLFSGYNDGYGSTTIKFHSLCGFISFKVSGDYDSYTLTGKNGEIVGYSEFVSKLYKKTDDSYSLTYVESGTPLTSISGTLVADGSTENRVYIPGGVNFTGGFTLFFSKGGVIKQYAETSKPITISNNDFLPIGLIPDGKLHDYVAPAEVDHVSSIDFASATDLSATATANSYIVTAAGKYKIKLVKGNSSDSVGDVNGQELLWETYNTDETVTANSVIAALDRHIDGGTGDRYLVFETPATLKPGNALIAAKDASDNILWSWHIWIPETTINDVDAGFAAATAIMDRNLGAIVATATGSVAELASNGLYYQWGRKDPLFSTNIKSYPSSALSTVTGTVSTDGSIKNPTVFYYNEGADWNSTTSNNLWDSFGSKTIYDPCPAGYRVPGFSTSYDLWVKTNEGWTFDETNKLCTFTGSSSVIPYCGYINGTGQSISGNGSRALIWSSGAYSSSSGSAVLMRDGAYNKSYNHKACGASVRCVAE